MKESQNNLTTNIIYYCIKFDIFHLYIAVQFDGIVVSFSNEKYLSVNVFCGPA